MILIDRFNEWLSGPRPAVQCPYCPQTNRNLVTDGRPGMLDCLYDNRKDVANGIIGADPPCVCDEYLTDYQLLKIGCAR